MKRPDRKREPRAEGLSFVSAPVFMTYLPAVAFVPAADGVGIEYGAGFSKRGNIKDSSALKIVTPKTALESSCIS